MIVRLAWRNIWRKKTRSLIIMLSVGLGLFAGLAVNALYTGMMKSRLTTLIHQEVGHIQIHAPGFKPDYDVKYTVPDAAKVRSVLHHDAEISFFTERTVTMAMLASTSGSAGVRINGIEYPTENEVSGLNDKIIIGHGLASGTNKEMLIGKKLADKMRLHPGSKVVMTFTDTSSSLVSGAFRVAGIFRSVNAVFDEQNVYVDKGVLDGYLGTDAQCHEISVLLKTDNSTDEKKVALSAMFPRLSIESWSDLSPETKLMNDTVDVYAIIIMAIIMIALSFGILNTMLMAVLERKREIGMMEALGMSRTRIFFLVIIETLFLTLTGIPATLAITYAIIEHYHTTGLDLSSMGSDLMNRFGFSTMIYPEFPFEKTPVLLAIVCITAFLSALLPALRMMKLNPVDALNR